MGIETAEECYEALAWVRDNAKFDVRERDEEAVRSMCMQYEEKRRMTPRQINYANAILSRYKI